jgi:hypothetical protein
LGPAARPLGDLLARAGLTSRWLAHEGPLDACRAIVVPPQSSVTAAQAERLRDYVGKGGKLIVCGDPGVLADMLGVRVKGAAAFAAKLRGATVKTDSDYDEKFAAGNLLDEDPNTAWASGRTPMPHWAEITFAEPAEISTVELLSRAGPYTVADVDIELPEANGWRVAKSVRNATARPIKVQCDAPIKAGRIRVKILRELFQGADRQYADVASIRVLDRAGRNVAAGKWEPIHLLDAAVGLANLALPPAAVSVEPTTAEVLARFDNAQRSPAILQRSLGKGCTWLITATGIGNDASPWDALSKLAIGAPTLCVSGDDARRYRFIFTRVGQAHVLHVIDAEAPVVDYKPRPVEISLAAQRLGPVREALQVENGRTLRLQERDGRLSCTVCPEPVATIVIQGAKP